VALKNVDFLIVHFVFVTER